MKIDKIVTSNWNREKCPGCDVEHFPYRGGSWDHGKKFCDRCRQHIIEQNIIEQDAKLPPIERSSFLKPKEK